MLVAVVARRSPRRRLRPRRPRASKLVGTLPQGFPPLTLPERRPVGPAAAARRRARASRSSRSPTRSRPPRRSPRGRGQEVDGNQEMIGIGAANIAAGLFQGFPVSTSGSRTAVAEQAGREDPADRASSAPQRSRSCCCSLPACCRTCPSRRWRRSSSRRRCRSPTSPARVRLWQQRRTEFWLVDGRLPRRRAARRAARHRHRRRRSRSSTCSGASWWPYQASSAASRACPATTISSRYPEADQLPGLVIFRFDAPLFFANARTFREQVRRLARGRAAARAGSSSPPSRSPTSTRPPRTC